MLRNIKVAFHFLDKDMMKKTMTTMLTPKIEYVETLCCTPRKKACEEFRKNTQNCNGDGAGTTRLNLRGNNQRNLTLTIPL